MHVLHASIQLCKCTDVSGWLWKVGEVVYTKIKFI